MQQYLFSRNDYNDIMGRVQTLPVQDQKELKTFMIVQDGMFQDTIHDILMNNPDRIPMLEFLTDKSRASLYTYHNNKQQLSDSESADALLGEL